MIKIKREYIEKIRATMINYCLYSDDVIEISEEIARIEKRQQQTRMDLSIDLQYEQNRLTSVKALMDNERLKLSQFGIIIE